MSTVKLSDSRCGAETEMRPLTVLTCPLGISAVYYSDENTLAAECRAALRRPGPAIRAKCSLTDGGLSCRLARWTVCLDHSEFSWGAAATQRAGEGGMLGHKLKRQRSKAGFLGFVQALTFSSTAEKFHLTDLSSSECLLSFRHSPIYLQKAWTT